MPPVHMLQNAKKNAVFPVHMFVAFPVTFFRRNFTFFWSEFHIYGYIFLARISHFVLTEFHIFFVHCRVASEIYKYSILPHKKNKNLVK